MRLGNSAALQPTHVTCTSDRQWIVCTMAIETQEYIPTQCCARDENKLCLTIYRHFYNTCVIM